jgi:hypothetical protein
MRVRRRVQLAALIEAHTGPAFEAALDLLTRTSRVDDIAPDISVYPDAPDPQTGSRQLAQLAFEIVSTRSVDVARSRVLEWSPRRGAWLELDLESHIQDPHRLERWITRAAAASMLAEVFDGD